MKLTLTSYLSTDYKITDCEYIRAMRVYIV